MCIRRAHQCIASQYTAPNFLVVLLVELGDDLIERGRESGSISFDHRGLRVDGFLTVDGEPEKSDEGDELNDKACNKQ